MKMVRSVILVVVGFILGTGIPWFLGAWVHAQVILFAHGWNWVAK